MNKKLIENTVFEKNDYTENNLFKGEYEHCKFVRCIFHKADLSHVFFTDCTFDGCDFSLVNTKSAALRNARFVNCKLLGVKFDDCNEFLFSASFENCILKFSSFHKMKLKQTHFRSCNLQEVDMSEADLTGSVFDTCDLNKTLFDYTNVEKVDFRTSYNYSIDPEKNRIKKAKFSQTGVMGLLDKYDIEIE
ncbi:pentapeptide repeat-containing protein [Microbacter margulisiae]|uniref:Uncharacterized protein YjbI with pentapeptide repeats n=1 Tax=Microbacter margulisiae TaxID=1350067 RepID=A0A7W5DSP1_9PORP|nr:pentapeptide repeat-containing protein [Microbacter margulisiae]MBB3188366.1 uncharacterized protein YjbI with pentapeptide repeats [Microbacter margulisiae]